MEQEQDQNAEAWARTLDPSTSQEAAKSMKGSRAAALEQQVAAAVAAAENGLTAAEIEGATGIKNESLTPRLAPLRRKGVIADSGIKRRGNSGRKQIVWVQGDGASSEKKPEMPKPGELVAVSHFEDFTANTEAIRVGHFRNQSYGKFHIEEAFVGFKYLKRLREGQLNA